MVSLKPSFELLVNAAVFLCIVTNEFVSGDDPLIIGHRGSCGVFPEHTLISYQHAIEVGADYIECDVVMTKDGIPICRHEPNILETTNVLSSELFADRRKAYMIDGDMMEGFFSVDFFLTEINQLRAVQRLRFRDQSFNELYEIPTLREFLIIATDSKWARPIGVYIETKHPAWHQSLGFNLEDAILSNLNEFGLNSSDSRVFLQSFEKESLQNFKSVSTLKRIQLLEDGWDKPGYKYSLFNHSELTSVEEKLTKLATWSHGVGPSKSSLVEVNKETNKIKSITNFVELAHKAGLKVHPYTFRNEYQYLAFDYKQDVYNEYSLFLNDLKVDGIFTDFPETAANFLGFQHCFPRKRHRSSRLTSSDVCPAEACLT